MKILQEIKQRIPRLSGGVSLAEATKNLQWLESNPNASDLEVIDKLMAIKSTVAHVKQPTFGRNQIKLAIIKKIDEYLNVTEMTEEEFHNEFGEEPLLEVETEVKVETEEEVVEAEVVETEEEVVEAEVVETETEIENVGKILGKAKNVTKTFIKKNSELVEQFGLVVGNTVFVDDDNLINAISTGNDTPTIYLDEPVSYK